MGAERHMKDTLTHWSVSGSDGYGGFLYGTPRTLKCRWEEGGEQFINDQGEEVVSQARVYLPEDVAIGDFLALGDFTNEPDPGQVDGAYRVQQYYKNTDLRSIRIERKAML